MSTKSARKLFAAIALAAMACVLSACGSGSESGSADPGGSDAADQPPSGAEAEFSTDFSKHSVPLDQFLSGGPPKDGIPAIDDPKLVSIDGADEFLAPNEPVAVLERGGEVRAYPIQVLVWHEIVNDELGGEAVAVTYCPLCNSTVAFSREVDGVTLDFGTTGRLRKSDLVMYDRQTESWWQQLTAEAIVGELTGSELEVLPSQILPWEEVKRAFPDADVLSRDTGFDRDYGSNPYAGYDDPKSEPFALSEEADDRLPPKALVTAIKLGEGRAIVYPSSLLAKQAPVNDMIDGRPVVVAFEPRVASALDSSNISEGREVGAGAVFERTLGRRTLTFEQGPEPGMIRDRQTGSTWDATGTAVAGELSGESLTQIPSDNQFWFAVAAFFPKAEIR